MLFTPPLRSVNPVNDSSCEKCGRFSRNISKTVRVHSGLRFAASFRGVSLCLWVCVCVCELVFNLGPSLQRVELRRRNCDVFAYRLLSLRQLQDELERGRNRSRPG